jgi:hypothetical protein
VSDELVTHEQVMRWLPRSVADELTMALPPEQRGWYTREEAEQDGGRFVEVQTMSEREPRLLRTGDA